nr:capsid protein VP1 [Psittaciform chaphamaparvovirus 4]
MVESVTFTNVYMCYVTNNPYVYPNDTPYTTSTLTLNTGWGIIPNMLWRHFVTPKQWAEFVINHEAYHVESMQVTLFNMIPMTTQIAIQGTTTFTAFNNTIYGLGYTDDLYETSWENWFNPNITAGKNLLWKEGLTHTDTTSGAANVGRRITLPIYLWKQPYFRTSTNQTWAYQTTSNAGLGVYTGGIEKPTGLVWDPFNRPDMLKELRPGKNAITYHWESHSCDSHIWYNLDQLCQWWPYTETGPYNVQQMRPGTRVLADECDPDQLATKPQTSAPTNDYTVPNLANQPLMAASWWWKEMQNSIIQDFSTAKPDLFFAGTEYEQAKYLPTQFFFKLIPLFDDNNTALDVTAQLSVKVSLKVSAKKRRSAIYCPTWGPFTWKQIYSAGTDQIFAPSFIRYRTGGIRRTWQNIQRPDNDNSAPTAKPHWREDPYLYPASTVSSGTGVCYTSTYTTAVASDSTHKQTEPYITNSEGSKRARMCTGLNNGK